MEESFLTLAAPVHAETCGRGSSLLARAATAGALATELLAERTLDRPAGS